jgi:hypothetical protein
MQLLGRRLDLLASEIGKFTRLAHPSDHRLDLFADGALTLARNTPYQQFHQLRVEPYRPVQTRNDEDLGPDNAATV